MIQPDYGESYFRNDLRARYEMTELLREQVASLAPGSRVLDMGCGDLEVLKALARIRPDIELHGIDIGTIPAECLSEGIRFIQSDFETFDTPVRFELVLAIDILEHLQLPQRLVEKSRRLLRKGGRLYVNVPSVTKLFLFGAENFYSDYTHIRPYSGKGLARMLLDYGFSISRMETGGKTGIVHLPRFAYYLSRGLFTMNITYLNAAVRLIGGTAIEAIATKVED